MTTLNNCFSVYSALLNYNKIIAINSSTLSELLHSLGSWLCSRLPPLISYPLDCYDYWSTCGAYKWLVLCPWWGGWLHFNSPGPVTTRGNRLFFDGWNQRLKRKRFLTPPLSPKQKRTVNIYQRVYSGQYSRLCLKSLQKPKVKLLLSYPIPFDKVQSICFMVKCTLYNV